MARKNKNKNKKIRLPDSLENLEQDASKQIHGQVLKGHLDPLPEVSEPSVPVKPQDEFKKEVASRSKPQNLQGCLDTRSVPQIARF